MSSAPSSPDWELIPVDPVLVANALSIAERDIKTASLLVGKDDDWAYAIAYNAMLQAGRAFMFQAGLRPRGSKKHVAVIRYLERLRHKGFDESLYFMNKMRQRRHQLVYDLPLLVSASESEAAIRRAAEFVKTVIAMLRG